jgi:nucleotide-binding universal stress UspA family protein
MSRCLFVATDGSPAARSALRYALHFASAMRIDEIACLSVHEEDRSQRRHFAAAAVGAEMALATGSGGLLILDQPEPQSRQPVDAESVLDACSHEVLAAGFRFSPVCGTGVPSDVIADTAPMGEIVFLGRHSDPIPAAARPIGSTVSTILQRIRQTVVVCPVSHARIERIVLLMAGNMLDAELVARGITWADAMKVPTLVAVADSGRPFSRGALEAAERVVTNSGVAATSTVYQSRPEEFARSLDATDLLLVARRRRWGLVHRWFGDATEHILEYSAGAVAVMAKP